MNKLIETLSLGKVYNSGNKKTAALCDINLAINAGEYVAIMGPSGAGKSTLLHILGGLDTVSSGKVLFEGKDLFAQGDSKITLWRNRNVGFVFQFYHLIEELTVEENVILPSILMVKNIKTSLKKAQKLLKYLEIIDKQNSVPSQLSGGQKQKVAIARAIINQPQIIFCDEPTGNLDKDSADKVMALLENFNRQEGKTLLIVTHSQALAERANRIIYINNGKMSMGG